MKGSKTQIKQIRDMDICDLLRLEARYSRHLARLQKLGRVNTAEYQHLRNCRELVQLRLLQDEGDERCHLGGSHGRVFA